MLCHYKHRIGGTATFWLNFPSILSSKWQLPAHYSINHRSERGPFLWSQKPHGTIGGVFFCIQRKELVFSNNTKKKLWNLSKNGWVIAIYWSEFDLQKCIWRPSWITWPWLKVKGHQYSTFLWRLDASTTFL